MGWNPREHCNHRERGEAKWYWTYSELSALVGLKVSTLYQYRTRGEFDPYSLKSVVEFVLRRRKKEDATLVEVAEIH